LPEAALIIATMPARAASGSRSQASTTTAGGCTPECGMCFLSSGDRPQIAGCGEPLEAISGHVRPVLSTTDPPSPKRSRPNRCGPPLP
jgi:hypothetical protein